MFPLRPLLILYVHLLMNIRVYSRNVLPITASYACVFHTLCIYWFRVIFTIKVITLLVFVMTLCVYCEVLNECLYIFRLPRGIKEIKNLHKSNISPNESLYLQAVCRMEVKFHFTFNRLTPNDPYIGRTAPLTSKRCILYIYSTNICTEYFKHALCFQFFSLQMQFVS